MTDIRYGFWLGFAATLFVVLMAWKAVYAEEPHDHSKMGEVGEFYQKWKRPRADEQHRQSSCCNRTDCSLVLETQMRGGRMWARFELEPTNWYPVPASVIESNQVDPLESPDDRAHGCIIAGQVVCYVHGGGA